MVESRKDRTVRHTAIVVVLTMAGLFVSYVIMRPEAFMERVLTFALGVALAFVMLLAIERFNAEATSEEVALAELDEDGMGGPAVPPPPSPEQWNRVQLGLAEHRDRAG